MKIELLLFSRGNITHLRAASQLALLLYYILFSCLMHYLHKIYNEHSINVVKHTFNDEKTTEIYIPINSVVPIVRRFADELA